MYSPRNGRIVAKPELFSQDYLPDVIGREEQIKELVYCLGPATRKRKPVHAWLHGVPGTGKTSVVRFVLRQLEIEARTQSAYVNCFESDTLHSVLDRVLRDMRVLGGAQSSSAIKLEVFEKEVGDEPFVLVLDEIDQPSPKERDLLLYNFAATGKVGVVAISGSKRALFSLEPRVKSRLNPRLIRFPPYSADELVAILRHRAERALAPGSWTEEVLEHIAKQAVGDARVAVCAPKQAGYLGEATGKSAIGPDEVNAIGNGGQLRLKYALQRLTQHHRLLYQLVVGGREIISTDLWAGYLAVCKEKKLRPIAGRTFFIYVNTLVEAGLIKAERADARGNLRKFSVGTAT
jgi:cell division control protein 6